MDIKINENYFSNFMLESQKINALKSILYTLKYNKEKEPEEILDCLYGIMRCYGLITILEERSQDNGETT